MVCTHIKDAGRRGIVATLQQLLEYCSWFRIEVHVPEFVKLYCVVKTHGIVHGSVDCEASDEVV